MRGGAAVDPVRCTSCGAVFNPENKETVCARCWLEKRERVRSGLCFNCGEPLSLVEASIGVCGDCLAGRR